MSEEQLEVRPGPRPRQVLTEQGTLLRVPADWALLPPGDAGLTRRVKAAGPSWTVRERRGRRWFSQGLWAPAANIEDARRALAEERADPAYERRLEASRQRRAQAEQVYATDFEGAVRAYLAFHPRFGLLAEELARRIARHATPVGSGTVARTQRIPLEQRAEAATIAWMRHQTTGYDDMVIPREKGKRREVRRLLAQRSKALLADYRKGSRIAVETCPLQAALRRA